MPRPRKRPTLVLTGISSRLGRMLARSLHTDFQVIGIDPRGGQHIPRDVTVHALDLRRRKAEDIFRRNRIDAVIHLPPEAPTHIGIDEHRNEAVLGTQRVLDYCQKHDAPKAIILSTAAVYGPRSDNPQFLTEEAPLLAGTRHHLMRDLVETDMYATSFFWRHPEVDTVVLRPVHIVGRLMNAASQYLRLKYTPTILGFDPMMQIISPEDVISAIRRSLKPGIRGVFNIAGPPPLPLSELIRRAGHTNLPLPERVVRATLGLKFGGGAISVGAMQVEYLKYVCMVDDSRARNVLRHEHRLDADQTLDAIRR